MADISELFSRGTAAFFNAARGVLIRFGVRRRSLQLLGQVRDELVRTIEQFRGLIEEFPKFCEAWIVHGDRQCGPSGPRLKPESKGDYSDGAS